MIVPMARVELVGPRGLLPDAIHVLQGAGVLQLRSVPERPGGWMRRLPVGEVGDEAPLEELIARLDAILTALPAPRPAGGPVDEEGALRAHVGALEEELRALAERRAALEEERGTLAHYQRILSALGPLLGGERPRHVELLGMVIHRGRADILAHLEAEAGRLAGGSCAVTVRDIDGDEQAVLLAIPREHAGAVSRLLFERGVAEVKLPPRYAGLGFLDTLALILSRSHELPRELARVEEERLALARRWRGRLIAARAAVRNRLARLRAVSYCGATARLFLLSGWAPQARVPALARALDEAFGGRVTLVERPVRRAEYGEIPVILSNGRFARPFELVLSLLPLPRYGSVDPTPLVAVSFPLFFGLMLGDVGYGLLALVLTALARRAGWGGETGRRVTAVAACCAASAVVFGVLFGEAFGELGAAWGLAPVLFHRTDDVLLLLALAVGIGVVHVVIGMSLGVVAAARGGTAREAVGRAAAVGAVAATVVATIGALVSAPAAAAALWAVGPLALVAATLHGWSAGLEIVTALGNMLSYARLMAVGVASLMLAEVANRIASLAPAAVVGAIALHAVNFALGILSPTIQGLRLHYVECFEKFFVPGGRRYEPLALAA